MGILRTVKKLNEHNDINQSSVMYDLIDKWKILYSGGDFEDFRIRYHTINRGTQYRRPSTLAMPKVASSKMARLIYNEKCEINIDNEQVAKLIDEVFEDNNFDKNFQDYIEYMFALGTMVIKPYFDGESIKLNFVSADNFVPISWLNGDIREAVFPREFKERDAYYTHLEWHVFEDGVYTVKNELYRSSDSHELGAKVSLSEVDSLADITPSVPIGLVDKPLFAVFKPNVANNFDMKSPMGISLFANALDTIKAIDRAYDSFEREFRLGKKRILVPSRFIKTVIDPSTNTQRRYFDAEDETYEAYASDLSDEAPIKDVSVELRVEEHIEGINALLNYFSMQTGFSFGAFTFDGKSMKTATEVVSENSETFKSKQSHEVIIESALKELVDAIITVAELYDVASVSEEFEVSVAFDDSIAEDRQATLNYWTQLVSHGLASRKRVIKHVLKLTDEEIEEELQLIADENKVGTPEMIDFYSSDSRRR